MKPLPRGELSASPDGRFLVVRTDAETGVYDAGTGELLRALGPERLAVAWRPDGEYLALGGSRGGLEITPTLGGSVYSFTVESIESVVSVDWSRDGRYVAAAAGDQIRAWDLDRQRLLELGCTSMHRNLPKEERVKLLGAAAEGRDLCPDVPTGISDLRAEIQCSAGECTVSRALIAHFTAFPELLQTEGKHVPTGEGLKLTKLPADGLLRSAGLRDGDLITRIDQTDLRSEKDIVAYFLRASTLTRVTISYLREGKPYTLIVTAGP